MELRWLILCDKNGRKTEPILEYKDNRWDDWETVGTEEIKDWGDYQLKK